MRRPSLLLLRQLNREGHRCLQGGVQGSVRCFSQETKSPSKSVDVAAKGTASPTISDPQSSFTNFMKYTQEKMEESSGLIEITRLKQAVQEASERFDHATQHVADCRTQVVQGQKAHEQAHKKHVSLLMRRDEWSPEDATSFVSITSEEVNTRQALLDAQDSLRRSEDAAIQCQHAYMDVMRQRYHEEQLWQDKWRLLGTYGTWSLIGVNTVVFLVGQYRAEQREISRLDRMEQLLIKTQNQTVQAVAAAAPAVVEEETKGNSGAVGDDFEPADSQNKGTDTEEIAQAGTETEDETTTLEEDPTTRKRLEQFLATVDTPSLVLGAAISASCVILVSLVSSR